MGETLTLVGTLAAAGGDALHGGLTPSFRPRRNAMRGAWEPYEQYTAPWRVKYEREGSDRKLMLEYFLLQTRYTHLLYLDSDVLVEPDTLEQMLAADVPVVSAWFPDPKTPGNCFCFPKWQPRTGVHEIKLGCIGCTLLTRAVAERLKGWPWVDYNGSDTHFWHKLRDLGIPKYVHSDVVLSMEPRQ